MRETAAVISALFISRIIILSLKSASFDRLKTSGFYYTPPHPDVELRQAGTKSRFIGTSFVCHELGMTNKFILLNLPQRKPFYIFPSVLISALTASDDFFKAANSSSVNLKSTISSMPFLPSLTGTPITTSLKLYSPCK